MKRTILSLTSLASMATMAEAHVGQGHTSGFLFGFLHPMGGLDHMLAMIAVGVLAASLGGVARWLVPACFAGMLIVGGLLGFAQVQVPFVEAGILASVIVLGAAIALQWKLPVALACGMAGLFAIFHGVAHGAEIPFGASAMTYATGFVVATAVLHGAGFVFGVSMLRMSKWLGAAISLAGLGLAAGLI